MTRRPRACCRATAELESLVSDIGDARILLDQQTDDRPFAMIEDLARLQQELQVETVSLALMQTELFAPGSDDSIAAATRAEQIADQAITRLPSDTKARREVERLKIESILRAGQYDRADRELKLIIDANDQPLSARWIALQTRLEMAQQRMGQAAARLDGYFGDQPTSAPRSIEMDLAKLEFMLRSDPVGRSGDWLEAIESRGGVYARRRAEAMALSLLGRSNSIDDAGDRSIDRGGAGPGLSAPRRSWASRGVAGGGRQGRNQRRTEPSNGPRRRRPPLDWSRSIVKPLHSLPRRRSQIHRPSKPPPRICKPLCSSLPTIPRRPNDWSPCCV